MTVDGVMVVGAVAVAAAGCSLLFWLWVMPRVAVKSFGKTAAALLVAGFGLVLLAVPAVGFILLPERTAPMICALIVAWGGAVRASAWFAARKYFVPKLMKHRRETAEQGDEGEETRR